MEGYKTTKEAAAFLGLNKGTFKAWGSKTGGKIFMADKAGKPALYRTARLEELKKFACGRQIDAALIKEFNQRGNLVIDAEFAALIPPLSVEEFQQLEENILKEGIRDPLIVWNGILIDGHNRYKIAQKYGLSYRTLDKEFGSRAEVENWIIENQLGRRNISAYTRAELALRLEPAISARAKENQGKRTDLLQNSAKSCINTRAEIARIAGVSQDTVAKVKAMQGKISEEVLEELRAGRMSINQAYKEMTLGATAKSVVEKSKHTTPLSVITKMKKMTATLRGLMQADEKLKDLESLLNDLEQHSQGLAKNI